jgi:hypothetical protein
MIKFNSKIILNYETDLDFEDVKDHQESKVELPYTSEDHKIFNVIKRGSHFVHRNDKFGSQFDREIR